MKNAWALKLLVAFIWKSNEYLEIRWEIFMIYLLSKIYKADISLSLSFSLSLFLALFLKHMEFYSSPPHLISQEPYIIIFDRHV